jgi:hypothetical protein
VSLKWYSIFLQTVGKAILFEASQSVLSPGLVFPFTTLRRSSISNVIDVSDSGEEPITRHISVVKWMISNSHFATCEPTQVQTNQSARNQMSVASTPSLEQM